MTDDLDLGHIDRGHVCKHGVRWPHACRPCDDAAWALTSSCGDKLEGEGVGTGFPQLDFAIRLRAHEALLKLSQERQRLIMAMTGEHRAGEFGWRGSNSTVQMRAMNRDYPLIERTYRGGCNVYRLAPLGLAVRQLLTQPLSQGSSNVIR